MEEVFLFELCFGKFLKFCNKWLFIVEFGYKEDIILVIFIWDNGNSKNNFVRNGKLYIF